MSSNRPLPLLFLNQDDLDAIVLSTEDILTAVEEGLRQHGLKQVVLPPKSYLDLEQKFHRPF